MVVIALLSFLLSVPFVLVAQAKIKERSPRHFALDQLAKLSALTENTMDASEGFSNWEAASGSLQYLADRLGRAGFQTPESRRQAVFGLTAASLATVLVITCLTAKAFGAWGAIGGLAISAYSVLIAVFFFLRSRAANFEREILYRIPLFLEALILLVESGLGLLPAIERIAKTKSADAASDPVVRYFSLVYQYSANGLELEKALTLVANATHIKQLRHVMLHLDISSSEGAGIVSALRALSSHSHTEWKLSVEGRVRRLENLVVFPVFVSVLGLMLMTAAVPLVPILELRDSIANKGGDKILTNNLPEELKQHD